MKYSRNFYEIKNNQKIFKKILNEKKSVGHYDIIYDDITEIIEYSQKIQQSNIVLVGIGGSSLGARAVYDFLLSSYSFTKRLCFLDSIDPLLIDNLISSINLKDSHFILVSKSGDTIEPISIAKYIDTIQPISSDNSTVVTTFDSNLHRFAIENGIKTFEIPKNVSGRFSVFSAAGLLPLASVGIDVKKILNGCVSVSQSFFSQGEVYNEIFSKARFLVENKSRFNINIIFSYSSYLESFNKWYVQLWAESLGKINMNKTRQALTPMSLIGPIDQHSFLQLIIEGARDKTVTFIKIIDMENNKKIPIGNKEKFSTLKLDYLNGLSFNELLAFQADSTIESILSQNDIPCDVISIPKVDEYNIARLMFGYQLIVSVIGAFLQINTYNQPGVEIGKKILKKKINNSI